MESQNISLEMVSVSHIFSRIRFISDLNRLPILRGKLTESLRLMLRPLSVRKLPKEWKDQPIFKCERLWIFLKCHPSRVTLTMTSPWHHNWGRGLRADFVLITVFLKYRERTLASSLTQMYINYFLLNKCITERKNGHLTGLSRQRILFYCIVSCTKNIFYVE